MRADIQPRLALLVFSVAGWSISPPVLPDSSCDLRDELLVPRPTCVITGASDLEHLVTIAKFPLFMRTVHAEEGGRTEELDRKADMEWWISRGAGSVQLHPLVPLHTLYEGGGHEPGTVGASLGVCCFHQRLRGEECA